MSEYVEELYKLAKEFCEESDLDFVQYYAEHSKAKIASLEEKLAEEKKREVGL